MKKIVLGSIALGITLGSASADPAGPIAGEMIYEWKDLKVTTAPGAEVRSMFRGPTETLRFIDVHATTVRGRGATLHPPHQHAHEELLIVDRGTLETLYKGEWKKVGPGSVILIAPNVMHGFRNGGDTPLQYHVITWWTEKTDKSDAPDKE